MYAIDCPGVLTSGGSDEGGSEPMFGLSGVRKGDLNGFLKVLEASFSLRRLACGVDILACTAALGSVRCSLLIRAGVGVKVVCFGDAGLVGCSSRRREMTPIHRVFTCTTFALSGALW